MLINEPREPEKSSPANGLRKSTKSNYFFGIVIIKAMQFARHIDLKQVGPVKSGTDDGRSPDADVALFFLFILACVLIIRLQLVTCIK